MRKKGQTGGAAATLIAIIAGLILLYILFLPPSERAKLLDDSPGYVTVPGGVPGSDPYLEQPGPIITDADAQLLIESPGTIDYRALSEFEHPLASFTLYSTTDAEVLEEINPFYIKNGVFDKKDYNTSFTLNNLQNTENVLLSFDTKKNKGVLSIYLNGEQIYEFDRAATGKAIKLKKELLKNENTLTFSVSGVGMNFWETNEYSFENAKITGDVRDRSKDSGSNSFFITPDEGEYLERAVMKFSAQCTPSRVGKLTIQINRRTVFSAIPDCGTLSIIEFEPSLLNIGKNNVEFIADDGNYLIDQIAIKTELTQSAIPVYFFEVPSELFTFFSDYPEAECGRVDGVCPSFCDEDFDIDCCYTEYATPFWCDVPTANSDDRCVGQVEEATCSRCPSGYEDDRGHPAEACEELCGDDTDNDCPAGCSIHYDEDCCFDLSGDQYWCETLPTTGAEFTCVSSLSLGQCDVCPTNYEGEDSAPECRPSDNGYLIEELRPGYLVFLTMKFTDDFDRKEAEIYINGHLTNLQASGSVWQRDISDFIEPGNNAIEIRPYSKLNVRSLEVTVVT